MHWLVLFIWSPYLCAGVFFGCACVADSCARGISVMSASVYDSE